MFLGLWFILDAWNEKSKLFETPEGVKALFKKLSGKGSFIWSFILGLIFTLLKMACVATFMFSLILQINVSGTNPLVIYPSMALFSLGLVIPVCVVFLLIALGTSSEKLNHLRIKFRPYIRIISGLIIITATIITII